MARAISKILFILESYNVLAYLECVRSYAWSTGHSDPDLGSVINLLQYLAKNKVNCSHAQKKISSLVERFFEMTLQRQIDFNVALKTGSDRIIYEIARYSFLFCDFIFCSKVQYASSVFST